MTKTEFRKIYIEKREQLTHAQVEDKSLSIANQTLELPIWEGSVYSLFLSITDKKEINTEYLLNILYGKDKNVTVSKSHFKTYEMTHYLLTEDTKIKVNSWGIPEPIKGIEIKPDQIDVVFVPLLVFDKKGQRIGYGKGFYDRFLSKCSKNTIKVGVSLFEAEPQNLPTSKNDVPLDFCVTPEKVYRF